MRALLPAAVPVDHEGVLADLEAETPRDGMLALLDAVVHELLDPPAIEAQDVVVVGAGVELEHRHPVGEVVPRHEPRRLELGQHPIDRGQTDVLARIGEASVDVFGRQMPLPAALEDVEDLDSGQRDLESRLAQIVAFHGVPPCWGRIRIMSHAPHAAPAVRPPALRRTRLLPLLLLALPLSGGCVYRMAVQQGNFLDARQVNQVQVGMTRSQVRFLLGTPMLPPSFDNSRWDYLYTLQMRSLQRPLRQRLTVHFENDKVTRIENDGAPTEIPAATPAPATDVATPPASTPAAPAPAPDAPPSGRP